MTSSKITLMFLFVAALFGAGCEYAVEPPKTDEDLEAAIDQAFQDGLTQGRTDNRSLETAELEGYEEGLARGIVEGRTTGEATGRIEGMQASCTTAYTQGHTVGRTEGLALGIVQGQQTGYNQGYAQGLLDAPTTTYSAGYTAGYRDGTARLQDLSQFIQAYACIFDVYSPDGVPGNPEAAIQGTSYLGTLTTVDNTGNSALMLANYLRDQLGWTDAVAVLPDENNIRATVNGQVHEFVIGLYAADLLVPNQGYGAHFPACTRVR